MPTWGWWVAAFLLYVFWNFESMVRGYWFAGWWRTVIHRPLGDWHAVDIVPFMFTYVAIRLVSSTVASFREQAEKEKSRPESESQVK